MISSFAQCSAHLLDGGYSPVPLRPGEKRPLGESWDRLRHTALTPAQIADLTSRHPNLGLGVAGGFNGLVPVDIDTVNPVIVQAAVSVLPEPIVCKKGRRGFTAFYWDGTGMVEACKFRRPLGAGKFETLLEVLVTGQTVIPPTIHPDIGRPYQWLTPRTLFDVEVDRLPVITPGHLEGLKKALSRWQPVARPYEPKAVSLRPVSNTRLFAYARAILANEARELARMAPDSGRNRRLYDAACKLGKFIHHGIIGRNEVENELMAACESNGLFHEDDCEATFESGLDRAVNDPFPQLPDRQSGKRRFSQ